MQNLPPPKPLDVTVRNKQDSWKTFKSALSLYLTASGAETKSKKVQRAILLHVIGDEGRKIAETFDIVTEGETETTVKDLIKMYDDHFIGKRNSIYERHLFRSLKQAGKEFDKFLIDVQDQAKHCNYGAMTEELIRDQIVEGIDSPKLKQKLLYESDLTLAKATEMCRTYENVVKHMKDMDSEQSGAKAATVDASFTKKSKSKNRFQRKSDDRKDDRKDKLEAKKEFNQHSKQSCQRCGYKHSDKRCPAIGKECNKCGRQGHFSQMCFTKKVHEIQHNDTDSEDDYFVGMITNNEPHMYEISTKEKNEWNVEARVGYQEKKLIFKLDSGAQANVLPNHLYRRVTRKPIKETKKRLITYNKQQLKVVGEVKLKVKIKDKAAVLNFIVIDDKTIPIIGLESCQELDLIRRVETVNNSENSENLFKSYQDVFSKELGGLKVPEVKIYITDDAKPVQNPPRRIPYALHDKVKEELLKMERDGIIKKITTPTPWINSMVIVEKPNGGLRICLDPRHLNKYIVSDQYKMPSIDEMTAKLSGSKIFSKLDARSSFWQLKLDEESAKLTTFSTPFGNFCFNRLPYGLNISSQMFQRTIGQIFEELAGVEAYVDDIMIHAENETVHDERLKSVLEKCREYNLKLNKQKCEMNKTEVKYLGVFISSEGQRIDPDRISSISKMPSPTSKEELHRFLGMLTYLGNFIPNLAQETALLRDLMKDNSVFVWSENHELKFQQLKIKLTEAPVLKFFNPKKEITVTSDASQYGLGGALLQDDNPVAFISRSLTDAEKNYSQIEKELLSIVFAAERFHQFVYGVKFKVTNDHKPLKFLFTKPLCSCPPRISRLMLRLQKYNIEYQWVAGKSLKIADTLSRAPEILKKEDYRLSKELEYYVHSVHAVLPFSNEMLDSFRETCDKDKYQTELRRIILKGWPDNRKDLADDMQPYWNFREELSIHEGLIYKNTRLLIPEKWKSDMLTRLHEGHLGFEKCLNRARKCMFWIGISKDIAKICENCEICQTFKNQQSNQSLMSHDRPDVPWMKLGADCFHFDNAEYLLLVDYYSNYFEVVKLKNMTAETTITQMKSIFARHGIPNTLITDNGTNFANEKFRHFTENWGINHETSSPHYPRSNGLAERYVGIVKKLLIKAKSEDQDPYLALLNYRDSPILLDKSPSQLLFGRRLRTRIPVAQSQLKPTLQKGVKAERKKQLEKQKEYFDRTAKDLKPLKPGQSILIWKYDARKWVSGNVISLHHSPRSYLVRSNDGNVLRRNRQHLKAFNSSTSVKSSNSPDNDPDYNNTNYNVFDEPTEDPNPIEDPESNKEADQMANPNAVANSNVNQPINRTSSGRISRKPNWMSDYDT